MKYYQLDTDKLMAEESLDSSAIVSCFKQLYNSVRAIFYLIKVMQIEIDEEGYDRISEDGKKFFKESHK